jgi:integrase
VLSTCLGGAHGSSAVNDGSNFRTYVWLPAHGDTIPVRRFHDLRGSMISWMILGGADLGAVMDRAGHTRLSTTQQCFDQFFDVPLWGQQYFCLTT